MEPGPYVTAVVSAATIHDDEVARAAGHAALMTRRHVTDGVLEEAFAAPPSEIRQVLGDAAHPGSAS